MAKPAARFEWVTASAFEKAEMVRVHVLVGTLSDNEICRRFDLSARGLLLIIEGNNWRPEYMAESVNEI